MEKMNTYRLELDKQIKINRELGSVVGNMTKKEKLMNRDSLHAYKNYDHYAPLIPGISSSKFAFGSYGSFHGKVGVNTSTMSQQRFPSGSNFK